MGTEGKKFKSGDVVKVTGKCKSHCWVKSMDRIIGSRMVTIEEHKLREGVYLVNATGKKSIKQSVTQLRENPTFWIHESDMEKERAKAAA